MRKSKWPLASLMPFLSVPLALAAGSDDVLKTAWKDSRLATHQEAVQVAVQSHSINPLEKADLRVDRGQLTQQDIGYGLRFYPRGYTEYKTAKRFQEALEKNEKAAYQEALSKILSARYDLLSRVILMQEKKKNSTELSDITQKASRALSYAAQKNRGELKSYLKTKADLEKINLKIADVDRDYAQLQRELSELSLSQIEEIKVNDLIEMKDIRSKIESIPGEQKTLTAKVAELDLQKSREGINYERAKDDKWLDHVEVSIKEDKGERVYGFEFAFNLPFAGAPDLSRIDKEARELRDKAKLAETLESSGRAYKNALAEIKTLLDLHERLKKEHGVVNADKIKKSSQVIASQDPMLSLELQKVWFESREQVLDLEFRIRALYILFLHESSTIAEAPEVNYFSRTGKRIQ